MTVVKTEPDELNIVCVFCNAVWTAEMQAEVWITGGGCDTCDYGREEAYKLTVKCSNCKRVVYTKEGTGQ